MATDFNLRLARAAPKVRRIHPCEAVPPLAGGSAKRIQERLATQAR
jgi:hypothetical protein